MRLVPHSNKWQLDVMPDPCLHPPAVGIEAVCAGKVCIQQGDKGVQSACWNWSGSGAMLCMRADQAASGSAYPSAAVYRGLRNSAELPDYAKPSGRHIMQVLGILRVI